MTEEELSKVINMIKTIDDFLDSIVETINCEEIVDYSKYFIMEKMVDYIISVLN